MLNFIFVFLIVVSFVFYFYFKTKQFRSTLPIRKKWYSSRASIALGSLLVFFGINQMVLFHTTLTYVVCSVFILLGLFTIYNYTKVTRHYAQFVEEEARLNK